VLENNKYYVMKETSRNAFEKIQVKVGKNYDRNTEITSGLKQGDRIISEGSLFVLTGFNLK
jgi:membrane fusion protein, heavy metal efflux system